MNWGFFHIRSSHQRCSLRKGVLRNFTKFTGKHLCLGLFFNKVAGLQFRRLEKWSNHLTYLGKDFWQYQRWLGGASILPISPNVLNIGPIKPIFFMKALQIFSNCKYLDEFGQLRRNHSKMFNKIGVLKISQNSQENTGAGVPFY